MSGGGQTQTTVQNKDPWAPAQPALKDIISQAGNLYNSGAGSQVWGGPLVASPSPYTTQGLTSLSNTAYGQFGTASQPYNYGLNTIQNNGLTSAYNAPLSTYGNIASGQNGLTTGQDYANVAGAAGSPTASSQYLTSMANGSQADNPYLRAMLDSNNAIIANRVNSAQAGMGRYGSAGHTQALTNALTAADNPVLAQAYSDQQNRQLSAAQAIDAANRAAQGTQLSALGGQTGVQGQNISNQLAGAQGQTGIYNFGQGNAANMAGLLPQLSALSYAPGNALMGAGDYQNQSNQQNIDAQRALFQQQQQMPWTMLNNYLGDVSGLGGLIGQAGTTTGNSQTAQQPSWTQMAGLGIAGLGLLSDRNEKTDIQKVGKDDVTGLDLYAYRYKDDPKTYPKIVGPMAQDVEKAFPGSTERVGGKLYVKREAAGLLGAL